PASLSNLTRLRKLNLSHNLMTHLPGCIYSMKALVFLDLSCNRLENVAENIQALLELKILLMEGNHLHSLPRGLCFLTRLELLNLDFNCIRDLPEVMAALVGGCRTSCAGLDRSQEPLLSPIRQKIKPPSIPLIFVFLLLQPVYFLSSWL
uniref:Uncharacterized protein n=1 Tax=Poecilia latipinna TaxID=48699 RepID=A0A3B3UKR6_9TELE